MVNAGTTAAPVCKATRATPLAVQAGIARNQGVHVRIVERPHHHLHGVALQRMEERANLPSSKMAGEEEHTLAALLGGFEIFEALVHSNLRDVFLGVARKETGFTQ